MQQLRLFCPYMCEDSLIGILSAEKRNYPPQIQSPAQVISLRPPVVIQRILEVSVFISG